LYNWSLEGHDLTNGVTRGLKTAEECMARCAARCDCGAGVWGWTGTGTAHTCYLKSTARLTNTTKFASHNAAFLCKATCPAPAPTPTPPGPAPPGPAPPGPAPPGPHTLWRASVKAAGAGTGEVTPSITSLLVDGPLQEQ